MPELWKIRITTVIFNLLSYITMSDAPLALIATSPHLYCAVSPSAIKCRNGKNILYTQDCYCPSGYTDITTAPGRTVWTIGKNAQVMQQENEFLQRRAAENSQCQGRVAHAQVAEAQMQASNAALCASLASQARSLQSAMRQPTSQAWLDNLKQQHRNVRDLQYRNRC
ncbi:hypothetical protein [Cupriavidus nantongensis]|uniref:hypothetical protein n=1 Tax=Cupriavidus nantongensis TaxID=1796606 RepID=UPI00224624E3|nr:hypothetical protein [Cupriavidus nantongensis]